jgi:cytochrome P450
MALQTDQAGHPTVAIDVESPDYACNWATELAALRAGCPMAWSSEHGGFWLATRYHDVLKIAQDDRSFTSGKTIDPVTGAVDGGVAIPPMPFARSVPVETDRGEWEGFRNLLNPRLGPKATEAQRALARAFADALIDRVIESGRIDLVQDFTSPLTALVTMAMIGFPLAEWRRFADPLHELMFLSKASPAFPAALAELEWIDRRIDEEIAARRRDPKDDLIGYLVAGEIDGAPVGHDDIHQMVVNMLFGGVDTTTALTSNVLVHLWRHPDDRVRLMADRSLLPVAREEFIRFFTPVHANGRTTRTDSVIAGQAMKPGERIMLMFASANRDETVFERPDEVDIARFPNRHIGFGAGIHRCIGSFLARMMFEVMIEAVFDRLPDYRVEIDQAEPYPSISPINGWVNIPARFTPGARINPRDPDWMGA